VDVGIVATRRAGGVGALLASKPYRGRYAAHSSDDQYPLCGIDWSSDRPCRGLAAAWPDGGMCTARLSRFGRSRSSEWVRGRPSGRRCPGARAACQ